MVSEKTGQPVGFWLSLGRQLAHYIDQLICNIDYLLPLWDDRRQTLADKITSTICVPILRDSPGAVDEVGIPANAD